jgi:hypothetical protein
MSTANTSCQSKLEVGAGQGTTERTTVMMQAVIFDYGSVLTRTLNLKPRAAWEDQLGLEPGGLQQRVHNDTSWSEVQCGRLSVEAYWLDVGQQ